MKIKFHYLTPNTLLQISFIKNFLSGVVRFALGIFTNGMFLIIMSGYNFLLCFTKVGALSDSSTLKSKYTVINFDKVIQLFMYIFMIVLAIILDVISIRIYQNKSIQAYNLITVLILAAGSFSKLGLSVYGLFTKSCVRTQLIYTIKLTNFADALFSIVLTQSGILYLKQVKDSDLMNTILGVSIAFVIIILAIKGIITVLRMDEFKKQWQTLKISIREFKNGG